MSNTGNAGSVNKVPYIKELERVALKLLRKNPNDKEGLKEILENYATRYAREYSIRA